MRTVLALLLVAVLARVARPGRCGDLRWFRYDDADEFGYAEWGCMRSLGHRGNHAAWYPGFRAQAERQAMG